MAKAKSTKTKEASRTSTARSAETRITNVVKSHSDTDGIGPVKSWDDGVDAIAVNVPGGKKFTRYEFVNESVLGSASVSSHPARGASGNVTFRVKWNYALFGKAQYRLMAYCDAAGAAQPPITILYGSPNWDQRANNAVAQGIPFKIVVKGLDACTLGNLLAGRKKDQVRALYQPDRARVAGVDDAVVVITLAVIVGVIVVAGFAVMAMVMTAAINAGKCVNSTHKSHGFNPFDDELIIDVHEC